MDNIMLCPLILVAEKIPRSKVFREGNRKFVTKTGGDNMRLSIWEKLAIEQLREIELKKSAYKNTIDHISRLKSESTKMKGPVLDSTPVSGGRLNKEEERRLNNISLCEELELNAKRLKKEINTFDQAWDLLTKNEQIVLTYFYIDRPKNHIEKLMNLLGYEKTQIYKLKDDALYKFSKLTYGA